MIGLRSPGIFVVRLMISYFIRRGIIAENIFDFCQHKFQISGSGVQVNLSKHQTEDQRKTEQVPHPEYYVSNLFLTDLCLYLINHSHTEVDWMTGVRIRMHFSVDILRHAESECLVMKLNDSHGPHCDEPAGTISTTFATNTWFRKLRDRALMVMVSFL